MAIYPSKKRAHKGRYGNARICPRCKKVILRDEPYVGKYHKKCYNSLLISG